jgi:RNA 2',3'-cyclic 3'-phosphodiesterase
VSASGLRLFVALDAPQAVVEDLAGVVRAVSTDRPWLRWVPPERWHLTLAFLGQVDGAKVDALCGRLARAAARYDPLALQLAGAGRFGSRVLWVGVRGAVADVGRLADSVAAGSRRAGIAVEDRRYRPHLTVARGRDPRTDLRPAVAALADYAGPAWTAAEVHLVRSHLGSDVRYERLATFALGSSPGPVTTPTAEPADPPDRPSAAPTA